jgi:hypothetical protein
LLAIIPRFISTKAQRLLFEAVKQVTMGDERYILQPLTNDGKRGFRLEIDEFVGDNEMTNLFLIALSKLQENSLQTVDGKPDWLTYYSLAGEY